MRIDPKNSPIEITILFPAATPLFEELKIDHLKYGFSSLKEACDQAKLPLEQALASLENLGPPELPLPPQEWKKLSFTELIDLILKRYHQPGYPQLLALKDLATQAKNLLSPEPLNKLLEIHVHELANDLKEHMLEEEKFIFPYLMDAERQLQKGSIPKDRFLDLPFNKHPLSSLSWEHEVANNQFLKLREMTDSYLAPSGSADPFKEFLKGLKDLDYSTHEHMHLENNILFQKAILLKILS